LRIATAWDIPEITMSNQYNETNLLKKYQVRERETPDSEGFARYSVRATPVNGTETEIVTEALSEDVWPEINAWIEAQEAAGV
jgi:hypothetical protein